MATTASDNPRRKRHPWQRFLLWTAACAGSLIAVIAAIVAMALWILTPARLTPLVEKYANGRKG